MPVRNNVVVKIRMPYQLNDCSPFLKQKAQILLIKQVHTASCVNLSNQ